MNYGPSLSSVYICLCATSVFGLGLWLVDGVGERGDRTMRKRSGERGEITARNHKKEEKKKPGGGLGELQGN